MSQYKTASIRYCGVSYDILLQETMGPCPLIALANYIILSSKVHIRVTVDSDGCHVSEEFVFKMIRTVLGIKIGLVLKDESEIRKVKEGLDDVLSNMKKCIHVNLEFMSTNGFSRTSEMLLFTYLGIPVLHGWIPNPKDETTIKAIGKSSDDLTKKLAFYKSREGSLQSSEATDYKLIKDFWEETKSQLTLHGLSSLRVQMIELLSEKKEDLAVLFRNGHFYVMHLYRGTLHTLETNYKFRRTFPFVVWQTLNHVTGDGIFVSSEYIATKDIHDEPLEDLYSNGDMNLHQYSLKLCKNEEEGKLLEEVKNVSLGISQTSEVADKQKQGWDPFSQASLVNSETEKKGNHFIQASKVVNEKVGKKRKKKGKKRGKEAVAEKANIGVPRASEEDPPTARSWFLKQFLKFLNGAFCEESQRPYYEGKVAAMKHWNCFDFSIEYPHLEHWNKKFARFIRDNYERFHADIEASVVQFLKDHGVAEADAKKATVSINDLPVSVTNYVKEHQHNLVEYYELYANKLIKSTSRIGRRLARRFLKFIIDKHREGWCWDGEWKESDMEIINGGRGFSIRCLARHRVSRDGMIADFENFIKVMFKHYESKEADSVSGESKVVFPCFFGAFTVDIRNVPDPEAEPEKLRKFQRYLCCHLAFMSPLACSDFIGHLFTVSDNLRAHSGFPFSVSDGKFIWRRTARQLKEPFASVYAHRNYLRGPFDDKYKTGGFFFLKFLRNFTQHMLKYAKTPVDIAAIHIYIAYHLEQLTAELILFMNYNCNSDLGGPYASTWIAFEDSECN